MVEHAAQEAVQNHTNRAQALKLGRHSWAQTLCEIEYLAQPLQFCITRVASDGKPVHRRQSGGDIWCPVPLRAGIHELIVDIEQQSGSGGEVSAPSMIPSCRARSLRSVDKARGESARRFARAAADVR